MTEISIYQVRRFVQAQRNERKVNPWEGYGEGISSKTGKKRIGCILVHFVKSKKIENVRFCGFNSGYPDPHSFEKTLKVSEGSISQLFEGGLDMIKDSRDMTYGELKKRLRPLKKLKEILS